MRLHRGGEHFGRHAEEILIERAHQHDRPFGQPGILGEQALVLDEGQLLVLGHRLRGIANDARPLIAVEDDFGFVQLLAIIGESLHIEGLRRHESMAARLLAALDAVDLERHDLAVEQAEDGMQRAHPAQPPLAPAHGFRPGKVAHDLRHDRRPPLLAVARPGFSIVAR